MLTHLPTTSAHSEPYLWEKGSSGGYRDGARYLNAEQDFEYGSRVGVWRLMRLFKEFDWNITIYAVARAMQLNPSFGKYCVQTGHEIANHGLRWLDFWDLGPEEDKKYVRDSQKLLQEVTGEFPVGVYFGRATVNTPGRLAEDFKEMSKEWGTPKLLYSSECYNDDVPYWVDLPYEKDLPDGEKEGMLLVVSQSENSFHLADALTSDKALQLRLQRWQVSYGARLHIQQWTAVRAVSQVHIRHALSRRRQDDEYSFAFENHGQGWSSRGFAELHEVHLGKGGRVGDDQARHCKALQSNLSV